MKPKKEVRYFNFPIAILKGNDIDNICKDIFNYCVWKMANHYAFYQGFDAVPSEKNYQDAVDYFQLKKNSYVNWDDFVMADEVLANSLIDETVFCSINVMSVKSFLQRSNKTKFEERVFRAYCGLRSILGKSKYIKTNLLHLTARMYGFNSHKEFIDNNRILTRYQWDTVRNYLRYEFNMKYYSFQDRGFYFGFNKSITDKDLAIVSTESKRSFKNKELKTKDQKLRKELTAHVRVKKDVEDLKVSINDLI